MYHLQAVNKYFWKYRKRYLLGILFIILSNYFRILSPQVSGYVVNKVELALQSTAAHKTIAYNNINSSYDILVVQLIDFLEVKNKSLGQTVAVCGITLLILAILGGFFMFLMRQTVIVSSRHIEYDQKNEIFEHYQRLDANFFKTHNTGDLMNRITEDVSRVRMYTGPALMYFINLAATIGFSLFFMFRENWRMSVSVLSPLPILAFTIYYVNNIINRKSEKIQSLLSDLTTTAQESYSGIRVIKSFVQEKAMLYFFNKNSENYRDQAIDLARVEALYFPAMSLLIGLSTLLTIAIGGWFYVHHQYNITAGTITEFVIYINLLTFPVSAIGWTASMVQRGAASQKRLNEFLNTVPNIEDNAISKTKNLLKGDIIFKDVSFTYPNTGITALNHFNLHIQQGQKVLILGKTGSGKSTIAQLLLRFYDPTSGSISIDGKDIKDLMLHNLREAISYVPQDVFLFSDSISNNISFGLNEQATENKTIQAAFNASVHNEILRFDKQYETVVGERGITLSGGQKQRVSIARALIKDPQIVLFDDCLSAVDAKTEQEIVQNLAAYLAPKTAIIITHRILLSFHFDQIIVLENGNILEQGTAEALMQQDGYYAELYRMQMNEPQPYDLYA